MRCMPLADERIMPLFRGRTAPAAAGDARRNTDKITPENSFSGVFLFLGEGL